ncbi:extracellular solute-binding protein [Nocardioides insulae]|uniref:extracellular solute-binding protein n=1 Tax=Nocardioides insulae TaxID=394734 RepID=UPI00048E8A85|nr:extracellular solute-binding protein [Nocardioides insulae]
MRASLAVTLTIGLAATLAACSDDSDPEADAPSSSASSASQSAPAEPAELTIGVWGTKTEVKAFDQVVDEYNAATDAAKVTLVSWPDSAAMQAAIQAGGDVPDVFLLPRADVPVFSDNDLIEPVDEPLAARAVDLGDGYSRQAIEEFSADGRLQCMPYGVSPEVIYINTDLVDFERMRVQEFEAPADETYERWSWDEFNAAAEFATRPRRGISGLAIEPTLEQMAPFILSGGGHLVDDEEAPTSLAFSDDDTRAALEPTLETLRNAAINLPPEQLAKKSAVEWFKEGKVGMIEADRSLVPQLREIDDLRWDVMPIPRIDSAATIGDYTGLCLSSASDSPGAAADLLTALISDQYVAEVAQTGYLVPVNQRVALSERFLQTNRQPLNSKVFVSSIRTMSVPPEARKWPAVEAAVSDSLHQLVEERPTVDLEAVTEQIDEDSQPVFGQ